MWIWILLANQLNSEVFINSRITPWKILVKKFIFGKFEICRSLIIVIFSIIFHLLKINKYCEKKHKISTLELYYISSIKIEVWVTNNFDFYLFLSFKLQFVSIKVKVAKFFWRRTISKARRFYGNKKYKSLCSKIMQKMRKDNLKWQYSDFCG